jgi:hypothetical protein
LVAHLRDQLFHANESSVNSELVKPPVDLFTTIHGIRQIERWVPQHVCAMRHTAPKDGAQAVWEEFSHRRSTYYMKDPRLANRNRIYPCEIGHRSDDIRTCQSRGYRIEQCRSFRDFEPASDETTGSPCLEPSSKAANKLESQL